MSIPTRTLRSTTRRVVTQTPETTTRKRKQPSAKRRLSFTDLIDSTSPVRGLNRSFSDSDLSFVECKVLIKNSKEEKEAISLLEKELHKSFHEDQIALESRVGTVEALNLLEEELNKTQNEDQLALESEAGSVVTDGNIDLGEVTENFRNIQFIHRIEPQTSTMSLTINQIIDIFPTYSGEPDQLNQFLTTIQTLYDSVEIANQPLFIVILKSKLRGRAFEIINEGNLSNWNDIKNALQTELKPKVDLQLANQNLFATKQKPNESVKDFAEKIRKAKRQLDEATSREVTATLIDEMNNLNAKLAKQAFETNLLNTQLRTIVISANKPNLRESIQYAITQEQKFFNSTNHPNTSNQTNNSNIRRVSPPSFIPRFQANPNLMPRSSKPQYCYRCGKAGHFAPQCPNNPNRNRAEHKQEFVSSNYQRPFQGRYQRISYNNVQPNSVNRVHNAQQIPSTSNSNQQSSIPTQIRNIYVDPPSDIETNVTTADAEVQTETQSEN